MKNKQNTDDLLVELKKLKNSQSDQDSANLISKTIEQIEALKKAVEDGFELAQYASYSEIVGGVVVNRESIRKYSDKMFNHNHILLSQDCE